MSRLPRVLLWALLLIYLAAGPARAMVVAGAARDAMGQPVAKVLVSDGERIVASGPDGAYRLETRPELVVAFTAPPGHRIMGKWWLPAAQAAKLAGPRLEPAPPLYGRAKLAVISDPHLYVAALEPAWAPGRVDPRVPWRVWQDTMAYLKRTRPSLTLFPGDVAMEAEKGDMARGRDYMELAARAVSLVPTPWRAAPGNHDVRYAGGKVSLSLWRRFMGPARGVYFLGPVAVILLDNVGAVQAKGNKTRSCGRTSPAALAWLKALLALLPPDTPLLLASHYPLLSPLAGVNPLLPHAIVPAPGATGLALTDVDQSAVSLAAMLKERPLVGMISGHQHAWFNQVLLASPRPWHLVGAPALCGRWWQGDMAYGPLRFQPGFLEGQLSEQGGQWRLQLRMVRVTLPAQPQPRGNRMAPR